MVNEVSSLSERQISCFLSESESRLRLTHACDKELPAYPSKVGFPFIKMYLVFHMYVCVLACVYVHAISKEAKGRVRLPGSGLQMIVNYQLGSGNIEPVSSARAASALKC